MKNLIFSTTRQWNPGDELIMAGVANVFRELGERYNPIIFNRHPDVRSCFQDLQLFKSSRVPDDFHLHADLRMLESNLKVGFFDNSLKPDTDCGFADWVVFAGTPEWCNGRTHDLYRHILRHNIPVMILGVGGGLDLYEPRFLDVISKAKVLAVRDEATLRSVRDAGLDAVQLACPALLSARPGKERRVERVKRIGLIYQASVAASVIWNGCSEAAYDWQMRLHKELIREYGKNFELGIVCHYIDELPLAEKEFPDHEVLYSYCAEDYLDIYSQFDLVVGMRVHGIGAAASVGVPGVALAHCSRSLTCCGFLADIASCEDMEISAALDAVERSLASVAEKSAVLARHKVETMEAYKGLVSEALLDASVDYGNSEVGRQTGGAIGLRPLADIAKLVFALQEAADSGNCRGRGSEVASAAVRALDDLAEARRRNDDLMNSTSWRMTAPVRALKKLMDRTTRSQ